MQGLKDKFEKYFLIGAAVNQRTIHDCDTIIKQHFNSLTCDNAMKYESLCRHKGQYDFSMADEIYQYAKQNGLVMRGHTFVWHNQTPKWLFESKNRKELLEYLSEHVKLVGQRYQELIYAWDALNEAIEDKSDLIYRQSEWKDILGDDFVHDVFCTIKESLPNSKLFYNDYNETNPEKKEKIIQMIREELSKETPIDGVGMQCHISIVHPSMDDLKRAIEDYAKLGLRINITEMDVSMYSEWLGKEMSYPSQKLLEQQADVYEQAFKIFMEYHEVIDNVTLWGVADDHTWLDYFPVEGRKNWPLLFDVNHEPKLAFEKIMSL